MSENKEKIIFTEKEDESFVKNISKKSTDLRLVLETLSLYSKMKKEGTLIIQEEN